MNGKRPSIKDVAERAGVSWKTVSNVIHDPDRVRPINRARVEAAIAELGYRISVAGQQLRQGRSRVIALAVPDIASPYFAQLSRHVIRAAELRGHSVLIDDTGGDRTREREAASGYRVQFADGTILSPMALGSHAIAELRAHNPVVVLGELDLATNQTDLHFDHVAIDNIASAREATEHLIVSGRHRLGFLGAPNGTHGTGHLRRSGFLAALARHGLDPVVVPPAPGWDRATGRTTMEHVLDAGTEIDAVVCGNDLLAIGAMAAIRACGRTVGRDIAVLGWDDTEEGRYTDPALTTIAHDLEALATRAVDLLIRRIEGATDPVALHTVPHRLVVRGSTISP